MGLAHRLLSCTHTCHLSMYLGRKRQGNHYNAQPRYKSHRRCIAPERSLATRKRSQLKAETDSGLGNLGVKVGRTGQENDPCHAHSRRTVDRSVAQVSSLEHHKNSLRWASPLSLKVL